MGDLNASPSLVGKWEKEEEADDRARGFDYRFLRFEPVFLRAFLPFLAVFLRFAGGIFSFTPRSGSTDQVPPMKHADRW